MNDPLEEHRHLVLTDDISILHIVRFLEALYKIKFIADWSFHYQDLNKPVTESSWVNFYIKAWNIPQ